MGWKEWPYWVKGALLFSIVITGINVLGILIYNLDKILFCSLDSLYCGTILSIIGKNLSFPLPQILILFEEEQFILSFILFILIIVIIGAIIGWIYGKVKDKNRIKKVKRK